MEIKKVFIGNSEIKKIYLGDTLVYEVIPDVPFQNYLNGFSPINFKYTDTVENPTGVYTGGTESTIETGYTLPVGGEIAYKIDNSHGNCDQNFHIWVDGKDGYFGMATASYDTYWFVEWWEKFTWEYIWSEVGVGAFIILKRNAPDQVQIITTTGNGVFSVMSERKISDYIYGFDPNTNPEIWGIVDAVMYYPQSKNLSVFKNIETQNVVEYGTAQGYTVSSLPYLKKMDSFISDLKSYDLWDKFDLHYWAVGDGDLRFKSINIINPYGAYNGTPYGGLINNNTGIKGNGLDGFVNTNFIPLLDQNNNYKLKDAHRSAWITTAGVTPNTRIDGNELIGFNMLLNSNSQNQKINSSSSTTASRNLTGLNYKNISRIEEVELVHYINNETVQIDNISPSKPTNIGNQLIFDNGRSTIEFATYSLGSSIIGQDATNHRTAIQNNL